MSLKSDLLWLTVFSGDIATWWSAASSYNASMRCKSSFVTRRFFQMRVIVFDSAVTSAGVDGPF